MILSQLTTEKAVDVLCELTPFISNITADENLLNVLKKKIGKDKTAAEIMVFGANKISELAPILLKDHKDDIFGILAILNETTKEEVANQNILETMKQIKEAAKDKDLIDFFKSWQ